MRLPRLICLIGSVACVTAAHASDGRLPRSAGPVQLPALPMASTVSCPQTRWIINTASTPDGAGGTIVVWIGSLGVRAQRLDPAGQPLWNADGVPVCTAINDRYLPIVVGDGAGGAVIGWSDNRDLSRTAMFVQRIDANGARLWTPNGVAVRVTGNQVYPAMVSDGAEGVLITWGDGSDIYAQRVDAAGTLQWNPNGVPVCAATGTQVAPYMTPDGAGGAIIAWKDMRAAAAAIYAQRLDATGTRQWALDGVSLANLTGCPSDTKMTSDGAGGAIVAWADLNDPNTIVRAQAIDATGAVKWAANGVAVSSAPQHSVAVEIASDAAGGCVIGWSDKITGQANSTVRVQRLDAAGAPQWGATGVLVSTSGTEMQKNSLFAGDGSGGAYIVWQRSFGDYDLLAQHLDGGGNLLWGGAGLAVCEANSWRASVSTAAAGATGIVVAWADHRSDWDEDFYAQRLAPDGAAQWPVDGAAVFVDPGVQTNPAGAPDGAGGMFVAWQQKAGPEYDIYLRRINASGLAIWSVPVCTAPGTQLDPVVAPDGSGGVLVSWDDPRAVSGTFIQRIDANGLPVWAANGVAVPNSFEASPYPCMVADGVGGAILAGSAYCCGTVAVRINEAGAVAWNVLLASLGMGTKTMWQLIPDGAGGAIACWSRYNIDSSDLYAQRVDHNGVRLWGSTGVAVTLATGLQWTPSLTSDGTGGMIAAWYDERAGNGDVYAQRINGAGTVQWATDGAPIAVGSSYDSDPIITSDGAGGAFMAWCGGGTNVIAQRVDASGVAVWSQPKLVCGAAHLQEVRCVTPDGVGGVLMAWSDLRDNPLRQIYAQRLDGNGDAQWQSQGLVAGVHGDPLTDPVITADGNGNALVAWQDGLPAPRDTVQVKRFPEQFVLGIGDMRTSGLAISSVVPNPGIGPFTVSCVLPRDGAVRLELIGVDGRVVAGQERNLPAGRHQLRVGVRDGTSAGIYWLRLSQGDTRTTRRVCLLR